MRELFYRLYLWVESGAEKALRFVLRYEPEYVRVHPYRLWMPIVTMFSFVFVDNFKPADPRTRMQLTPFEVELGWTLESLFYSVTKIAHISYFFILYVLLRLIWGWRERRIWGVVFAVGLLIELHQAFTAGRDARPLDLLPDFMGAWLGHVYLKDRLRRGRPFSEPAID